MLWNYREKIAKGLSAFMAATNMDLDLDLTLDGLAVAPASLGAGSENKPTTPPLTREPKSRWSSTSSIESDADNFWVC